MREDTNTGKKRNAKGVKERNDEGQEGEQNSEENMREERGEQEKNIRRKERGEGNCVKLRPEFKRDGEGEGKE